MKRALDRKVFLIILVVAFLFSIGTDMVLTRKQSQQNGITGNKTNEFSASDSISVNIITEGVYLIDGEGTLDADTLTKALHKKGVLTTDVIHLIIGDAIVDMGYNCISRFPYLESVRFGLGMSRIRNGVLLSCPGLEWVFLPDSVKWVGKDFLYDCPKAIIVLQGSKTDVENVNTFNRVIDVVDSFEKLEKNASMNLISVIKADLLYSTGTRNESGIELKKGETQFGPYIPFDPGTYTIEVVGNGLGVLDRWDIFLNSNSDYSVVLKDVTVSNSVIQYSIFVPNEMKQLELGIHNTKADTVIIEEIRVFQDLGVSVPKTLAGWWDYSLFKENSSHTGAGVSSSQVENVPSAMIEQSLEMINRQYHPLLTIRAEELYLDEEQEINGNLIIHPAHTQFGPCVPMEKGEYRVVIYGKSFLLLQPESFFVNPNSWFGVLVENLLVDDERAEYSISLPDDVYRLELGITNQSKENVEVNRIEIYKR